MITVRITQEHGEPVGFHVSGHAERGAYGNDLVCAAVSAIVQTAILGVTEELRLNAGVSIHEGETICILERDVPQADAEKAAIVINTMVRGLKAIQAAYPHTIQFLKKEIQPCSR